MLQNRGTTPSQYVRFDIFNFYIDINKNKQREAAYFAIGFGLFHRCQRLIRSMRLTCTKRMNIIFFSHTLVRKLVNYQLFGSS